MPFEAKNFEYLIGTAGFSDTLLETHFILYQGYVANTNKLVDEMNAFVKEDKTSDPGFSEMKRRFGWEFNGMRLHELYFGNMTKGGKQVDEGSKLFAKISEVFGSFENFVKVFKTVGMMRGIGWVVLYYDKESERLFNVWINEHDVGHLAGCVPLLVMDVFEHAFMIDYGLKRADYIEAFFKAIDWSVVAARFEQAL